MEKELRDLEHKPGAPRSDGSSQPYIRFPLPMVRSGRMNRLGAWSCRVLLFAVLPLSGCPAPPPIPEDPTDFPAETTPPPATPTPTPIDPRDALRGVGATVPMLDGGDYSSLRASIDQSLSWLKAQPQGRRLTFGSRTVTVKELLAALTSFRKMLADDPAPTVLEERVRAAFDVVEAVGAAFDGRVLFTGYYEPAIEASLTRRPGYDVPVYKRPSDFIEVPIAEWGGQYEGQRKLIGRLEGTRVRPYWSREEIGFGPLEGKKLEIAWAKDAVDLFFVEIQGSGTLLLPDGKKKRIGYNGSNSRPYRSIGSLLIEEGEIPAATMSMQSLRTWLAANPEEKARVLEHNESYVFFRFLEAGPMGSLNRPVTPERSIATDLSLFPPAALAFLHTDYPTATLDTAGRPVVTWKPLDRFVLNQDTGGAIKGAGRADVFWGQGPQATLAAGMMKQPGQLYFLVPKSPVAAP